MPPLNDSDPSIISKPITNIQQEYREKETKRKEKEAKQAWLPYSKANHAYFLFIFLLLRLI